MVWMCLESLGPLTGYLTNQPYPQASLGPEAFDKGLLFSWREKLHPIGERKGGFESRDPASAFLASPLPSLLGLPQLTTQVAKPFCVHPLSAPGGIIPVGGEWQWLLKLASPLKTKLWMLSVQLLCAHRWILLEKAVQGILATYMINQNALSSLALSHSDNMLDTSVKWETGLLWIC